MRIHPSIHWCRHRKKVKTELNFSTICTDTDVKRNFLEEISNRHSSNDNHEDGNGDGDDADDNNYDADDDNSE